MRIVRSPIFAIVLMAMCNSGCSESSKHASQPRENTSSQVPVQQELEPVGTVTETQLVDSDTSAIKADSNVEVRHNISFKQAASFRQINHTYDNGAVGQLLMVESIGGGVGWLDLDRDGMQDLFCVQGSNPTMRDTSGNASDQLFRQRSDGLFAVVTGLAGVEDGNYGQGTTIADFDNDGFPDIYITNVGHNQLFHNCGDGTFTRVASSACVAANVWSSSAAWADADMDGDLDLYVCNYLKYDPFDPLLCEKNGLPALCHPRQLEHWPDEFFENLGDGRFRSTADECGLSGEGNKALGVVVTDLSGDGWPDIYVANDTTANFYFVNQRNGTFEESSLAMGGGLSGAGAMQASMGIAAGDYNRSGTTDLFLTHLTGESNTLYQNLQERGLFDVSGQTGLFPISHPKLGFGTVMADFDSDGQMDLAVANGHIDSRHADGDGFMQRPQLLTFDGSRWHDVSGEASAYFAEEHVGRGMAMGDYDNDGDLDLVIGHQNEPLEILENTSKLGNWLKIVPIARVSNRSGIGTSAEVDVDGQKWFSSIYGGTSFCSSHEQAMFFGLGDTNPTATVTVTWPGGKQSVLKNVELNRIMTIKEP